MINAIGPVPSPLDSQAVFNTKAFNLLAQLPGFAEETNATAADMQTNSDVAAALITAMALPQFMGTSTSSLAIGTGAKSFATQTGKEWVVGQVVIASSGSNYMKGQVAAYDAGTGVLDVNVTSVSGSGTFASWTIGLGYEGLSLAKSGINNDINELTALVGPGLVPVGGIVEFAASSVPAGYLVLPVAATNISRTTYARLFSVIGTTWGAGDGSTTFGMPWIPADYSTVQANGNVGTTTTGSVIAHTHSINPASIQSGGSVGGSNNLVQSGAGSWVTGSTGGSANMPAGVRMVKCIKY